MKQNIAFSLKSNLMLLSGFMLLVSALTLSSTVFAAAKQTEDPAISASERHLLHRMNQPIPEITFPVRHSLGVRKVNFLKRQAPGHGSSDGSLSIQSATATCQAGGATKTIQRYQFVDSEGYTPRSELMPISQLRFCEFKQLIVSTDGQLIGQFYVIDPNDGLREDIKEYADNCSLLITVRFSLDNLCR